MQQRQLKNTSPMRSVLRFTLMIALGVVFTYISGFAQDEKSLPEDESAGQPIEISADRLDSDPVEKYAEFIGNVKATQADYVITCQSLKIYYDGDLINRKKDSSDKDLLKKIVASGNVEINSNQFTAKTERLEYDFKSRKLELSGQNSKITMGKNSITGTKITYFQSEERFKVEGGSDKRVNAVFFSDGTVSDMFGDQEVVNKPKE